MLDDLPSIGQLYGSWGYELINRIEPSVPINEKVENNIPYGSWMFFDQIVVFDQIKRCITAVVYADTTSTKEFEIEELYLNSISKIKKTRNLMRVPLKENEFLDWNENENFNLDLESNWEKKDFEDAVLSAKEYIRTVSYTHLTLPTRFSV